jgi:putative tricarboxylic transport membrane protein
VIVVALLISGRRETTADLTSRASVAGAAAGGSARGPMLVAIGLAVFVALLNPGGFVVAGTALFACTASAFGSRTWLRDVSVGLALCAAVYVVFTHGLGVALPPGAFFGSR